MTGFAKHLVSKHLFPKSNYSKIESLKELYYKKKLTYRQISMEIPKIYAISFRNRLQDEVLVEAEIFADHIINGFLYPYAEDLVKMMKQYGVTVGLSGAPLEVVRVVSAHLEFDFSYGTELEVKNRIYTGILKCNLILKETKQAVFENIVERNKFDLCKSFGFGDTEQDVSFLLKVGNPIALNPNKNLRNIAHRNGWPIFCSGDDIINEL